MDLAKKLYTIDDIYNLPEGHRAELIDGAIYNMAPPSKKHQQIVSGLTTDFNLYIRSNNELTITTGRGYCGMSFRKNSIPFILGSSISKVITSG